MYVNDLFQAYTTEDFIKNSATGNIKVITNLSVADFDMESGRRLDWTISFAQERGAVAKKNVLKALHCLFTVNLDTPCTRS